MGEWKFESELYDLRDDTVREIERALDELAVIEDNIQATQDRLYRTKDAVKRLSQRLIDAWERQQ